MPLARGEAPVMKAGPQVMRGYACAPQHGVTTERNGQPASVPFNRGGYNFFAIPKFHIRFV